MGTQSETNSSYRPEDRYQAGNTRRQSGIAGKKSSSFGKLILTGEHSAVYGRPAIAIPLHDYSVKVRIANCDNKQWLAKQHPLIRYTIEKTGLADYFKDHPDYQLMVDTDLPVGVGLGASSAIVAALITLQEELTGEHRSFEEKLDLAKHCEDLAHGRSSGLDVAVALLQKPIIFQNGRVEEAPSDISDEKLYLINTGAPKCSTRDCVLKVAENFDTTDPIWNEFEAVFQNIRDGGLKKDFIRHNHNLLKRIGVVPEPVANFIQVIEDKGGAAKISGAGNIDMSSLNAGIVMVTGLENGFLKQVCSQHDYSLLPWKH